MEVTGIGAGGDVRPVNPTNAGADSNPAPAEDPLSMPVDEVEISPAGQILNEAAASSDLRTERLAQIKAAIDNGTYETIEKLEAAAERLLEEISKDSSGD